MAAADPYDPEAVRKRYLYRRLILTGRVRLPRGAATRLIGPDCAYHLYGTIDGPGAPDASAPAEGEKRVRSPRSEEEPDA